MSRRFPESPVFYRDLHKLYTSAVRGDGIHLEDDRGRRYVDACGGALVVNLGHGRRELADAMARQAADVYYVHGTQFTTDAIEAWGESLLPYLPGTLTKLYLVTGGTEATETAIKLARQFHVARGNPSKYRTLGCRPSYHGNTLGSLSVSGRDSLRAPYLPMLSSTVHAPAPYCYRCPLEKTYPECELACADALEGFFDETVAAFIVEPVLGASAGVAVPPPEYLPRVRELCDRFDVLLIADEVLTGFGRTGTFFAVEPSGVEPDLLLLGKGLTSGALPAGAVAVREDVAATVARELGAFTHGLTFSHHPVVAAVARCVLEILESENLVERVRRLETPFLEKLARLRRYPFVGDVRGRGLLAGIELVADPETRAPYPRRRRFAEEVTRRAFENGLLVYPSTGFADGTDGDAIVLAPPFAIDESGLEEIVALIERTFDGIAPA